MPKRKRRTTFKPIARPNAARSRPATSDEVIDLISSDDSGGGGGGPDAAVDRDDPKARRAAGRRERPPSSSSSSDDDSPVLNDTELRGLQRVITAESARRIILLLADFLRDEEAGKAVTFTRSLFAPLWRRLRDQGGGGGARNRKGGGLRDSGGRWRYETSRDPLAARNEVYVPPGTTSGGEGKEGRDYYVSEEHLVLNVLMEVTAMEEVEELFARNASCFSTILPVLDRAVTENIEYKHVRRGDRPSGGSSRKRGGGTRSCTLTPSCENDVSGNEKVAALPNTGQQSETFPASNLAGVEPKVFMPIEILDSDLVWNMAQIVSISYEEDEDQTNGRVDRNDKTKCYVTIRYDGWGKNWDETLAYPNSRLARMFTYTKRVKCFVAMLGVKKLKTSRKSNGSVSGHTGITNWTDAWPCKATFRMPHPNQNESSDSFKCLRERSSKIFVVPYSDYLLPPMVQGQLTHGGRWVSKSDLNSWKDLDVNNPAPSPAGYPILREFPHSGHQSGEKSMLSMGPAYFVVPSFCLAYQAAQLDWIQGRLPPNALLEGALLKDEYRVCDVGGDVIDGVKYSGALSVSERGENGQESSIPSSINETQRDSNSSSDLNALTKVDAEMDMEVDESAQLPASKVPVVPLPALPPPIRIKDIAYPGQGVRRLQDSNRWASILSVGGNHIFLGSYTSQSEAAYAAKLASAQSKVDNSQGMIKPAKESGTVERPLRLPHLANFDSDSPCASSAGRIADMLNTPIESIVSAFEETQAISSHKQPSQPPFRVGEWIAQHCKHVEHLKDLSPMSCQNISNNFSFIVDIKDNDDVSQKRRKKSVPKRLHPPMTANK